MPIEADAIDESGMLKLEAPVDLPDRTQVHVSIEPRRGETGTALGKRLRELRTQILASGEEPLDWEGIRNEVASRRGGWQERE